MSHRLNTRLFDKVTEQRFTHRDRPITEIVILFDLSRLVREVKVDEMRDIWYVGTGGCYSLALARG